MNFQRLSAKVVKGMTLLVAFAGISGCSMLSDTFGSEKDKLLSQQSSQSVLSDRWLDGQSRWSNWEVGDPNNKLVTWSYQEQALVVKLTASRDLNTYAQRPHTLVVKVVQLTDVSGIMTLMQTSDGVRSVLSEELEMIPNAVFSDTVMLAPKQTQTMTYARQQDAKFIALVTGFAELNVAKSVRIIPISVITEKQKAPEPETSIVDTLTLGFFAEEPEALPDIVRPATIKMDVRLGDNSITEFVATAQ